MGVPQKGGFIRENPRNGWLGDEKMEIWLGYFFYRNMEIHGIYRNIFK